MPATYSNVGLLYYNQGDYARALENFEKALKGFLGVFGENYTLLPTLYRVMYETHLKLLESDKSKLIEFENFMADKVWIVTIEGENSHAAKPGLNGEYVIYKLGEWNLDCQKNIVDINDSLPGKPKDVVLYRDGEILQRHFENQIAMQLSLKFVGVEKKKQIEEAYKKWIAGE